MLHFEEELKYVLMVKTDTDVYPRYSLPEGLYFENFKAGDEKKWVELEISVGQFKTMEEGLRSFNLEFVEGFDLPLEDRIVFVKNQKGEVVATGAVWASQFNGKIEQKLHWIAVKDEYNGKGVAKAMVTKLLDLYNQLGYKGFIYLVTETWCYSAVNIYTKFGFKAYFGNDPVGIFGIDNETFVKQNEEGWKIINERINSYTK